MEKAKLDLKKMSPSEKARFAYAVGIKLIDNEATFPDQPVPGADLTDFADAVTQAIADAASARLKWRQLVSAQNDMVAKLEGYLRQTANYVENVAAGNTTTIELAGLSVRNPNAKVGKLAAMSGFHVAPKSNPGTAELKWAKIKGAKT